MRDYLSRTEYLYLRKAILGMFGVAILVMTVWTAYAPAQTTDLNGKWTITWSGSTKTNTVTLAEEPIGIAMTILSGTFVADNGEKCTVRGDKSNGLDRQLDMDIDCATQHIKMTGTADADGKHILGGFNAYHPDGQSSFHSLGGYKMARDK